MEIWKDIENYEGLYQVSNLGRIKGLERSTSFGNNKTRIRKSQILKPILNKGYARQKLCKNGKAKCCLIHRLVGYAFMENPYNKKTINHKDGNKLNNNVNNLEWNTHRENVRHSFKELNRKSGQWMLGRKGKLHNRSKSVICTTTNQYYDSITIAAEQLGIRVACISRVLRKERTHTHGYKFKYAN